jgi:MFS family permease
MKTSQDGQEEYSHKSQKLAILSACFGSVAVIMIQDSAVIILFAGMIGAGSMLSMVTTSLFGVMNCFFLLPAAYLAARKGYKRSIIKTSYWGAFIIILLALTPYLNSWAKYGMIFTLICFGAMMTLYASAWFPFLDEFLPKKDRSSFFGMLRFSWQSCSVAFFFLCGIVMGKNPDLWILQTIIAITAIALLGRVYFVNKIEVNEVDRKPLKFRYGMELVIANKPLVGFSVYLAFLYLAAQGTMPLTYIYLKNYLHTPDNIVVIVSSLALVGSIIGFLCAGRMLSKFGVKKMLLSVHLAFALINFMLFAFSGSGTISLAVITILLVFYGFFIAISSVAASSEMMALANPDNKALAMAFCVSMCSAGLGGARLLSSVIIGSGILAPEWSIGAMKFTMFHTMYLGYGLGILFVCVLLVIVPAIFPKGEYHYVP